MSHHSARRRRRRFLTCSPRRRNVVTKMTVLIMILLLLGLTILADQEAQDQEQQVCTTGDKGGQEGSCHNPQQRQAEEDVTVEKLEKADDFDIRIADASDETSKDDDSSSVQACRDQHPNCASWATYGECEKNPNYMQSHCPVSCDTCPMVAPEYVPISFGKTQILEPDSSKNFTVDDMKDAIQQQEIYMQNVRSNSTTPPVVLENCVNQNRRCTKWALQGECDANPNYMKSNCAPACHSCYYVSIETRCPMDPETIDQSNIWKQPGDLHAMFTSLVTSNQTDYPVTVLSQPPDGPWIVQLDDVVSPKEADILKELGHLTGFETSTGVGQQYPNGTLERRVSKSRNSTNAWCNQPPCVTNATSVSVMQRLSDLVQIPTNHSEYLQLLRYEPGMYYKAHSDYIDAHVHRRPGVRIVTAFLYLNDLTEQDGGATSFTSLPHINGNLKVQPKLGRVVIWPSVLNDNPNQADPSTMHQAEPVVSGHKYAANAWFHQRDYKTPYHEQCI